MRKSLSPRWRNSSTPSFVGTRSMIFQGRGMIVPHLFATLYTLTADIVNIPGAHKSSGEHPPRNRMNSSGSLGFPFVKQS